MLLVHAPVMTGVTSHLRACTSNSLPLGCRTSAAGSMPLSVHLHHHSGRTFRRRSRSLPEALASKTMPLLKDNDRLPCARGGEARDAARSTTMLSSAVQYPTPEQRALCVTTIKRNDPHAPLQLPPPSTLQSSTSI